MSSSVPASSSNSSDNACGWKFCTEQFSTPSELNSHLAQHVQEAPAHFAHPKESRDEHLHHVPVLAGATADGERPAPHAEMSFPDINKNTGEVEPPLNREA